MKQLTIIGNIGRDAELKVGNGSKFISFTVAVNERYKNAQGQVIENTDWISVTTRQESLLPYLKKGTQVFVQGNLGINQYRDQQGNWKVGIQVNADKINLLSSKKDESTQSGQSSAPAPQQPQAQTRQPIPQTAFATTEEEENSLPF